MVVNSPNGQATGEPVAPDDPLWRGIWRFVESAPSWDGLRAHRCHLLAAYRFSEIGRSVPREHMFEELRIMARLQEARTMLAAARSAVGNDRLLVLKGTEMAARYPRPALRPFADIDLLAEAPEDAQTALIASGFEPVGPFPDQYYDGLHHLRPLALPDAATMCVEIHRRPNWVTWSRPPSTNELFAHAVPATDLPGLLTPRPDVHALIVLAHMWGEVPLRRVLDLIDLCAISSGEDSLELADLAQRYGLRRALHTALGTARGLFLGPPTWPLRTWARDLQVPRDRTVIEGHLRRWFAPWWSHPPSRAIALSAQAVAEDLTPVPGETGKNKLDRMRQAATHPLRAHEEHRRMLGPGGVRPRHRRW